MFLFLKTRRSSIRCWCLPWLLSIFELPCITLFVYTVQSRCHSGFIYALSATLFLISIYVLFLHSLWSFVFWKSGLILKIDKKKIDIHVFQFTHHFQHMISLNVIQYVTWKTKIIWRLIFSPIIHKYLRVI